MPSIGGRPSADEFAERSVDREDAPPAGFATDRLSTVAVFGTFLAIRVGASGDSPLWFVAPFAVFYCVVAARAIHAGRRLAALGWGLFLPALAVGSAALLPSVGGVLAAGLIAVGLTTVAYADHRHRRRSTGRGETTA